MPAQHFNTDGMNPYGPKVVFAKTSHCPPKCTTYQICRAAENNKGVTCFGAQQRAGLWRIQTNTLTGRILLLAGGLELNGKKIEILDRNPFIRGDVEDDEASTQLSINDLPFSFSSDAIERHLKSMGVKCRNKIKMECDRAPDGGVTEYRTGRRTVSINLPPTPLPKMVRIGTFQANLFHWEQKERDFQCRKCLGSGHKAFECVKEEVCMVCRLPGHRKGNKICTGEKKEQESDSLKEEEDRASAEKEKEIPMHDLKCTACDENGHEAGDIICPKWLSHIWGPDEDQTPVLKISGSEPKVRVPCKVCGDTNHVESSIECHGNFPSLESAGSPKKSCTECGQTGHEQGNSFCKGPVLVLRQNEPEVSTQVQTVQTAEITNYVALVVNNSFEILNTMTTEDFTGQTPIEDDEAPLYHDTKTTAVENKLSGKEEVEKKTTEVVLEEKSILDKKNTESDINHDGESSEVEENTNDGQKEQVNLSKNQNKKSSAEEVSNGLPEEATSTPFEEPAEEEISVASASEEKVEKNKLFPLFTNNVLAPPGVSANSSEIGGKRRAPASSPDGLAVGKAGKGARQDSQNM